MRSFCIFPSHSISLCTELDATARRRQVPATASPACIYVLGDVLTGSTHNNQLHSTAAAVINDALPALTATESPKPNSLSHSAALTVTKTPTPASLPPAALTATTPPMPASLPHSRDTLNAPSSDFWSSASDIVTAFSKLSGAISVPLTDSDLTDVQVDNEEHFRQELADVKLLMKDWLRKSVCR